jgi:HlyD family secretion protein
MTLAMLGVAIASMVVIPGWVRPSVAMSRLRTGVVERRAIEETVTAQGHVVPAFEHVITTPVASRVDSILLAPGSPVQPGQRIVALDVEETRRALEKLQDEIALKRNAERRARLSLEAALADLEGKADVHRVEIRSSTVEVTKQTRLVERDLATADALRAAEVALDRAEIELRHTEARIRITTESAGAELEGLALERSILEKDLATARDRLNAATAVSQHEGVVTWVAPEIGAFVAAGDPVARVADLRSFRVEATLSDVHADRVAEGQSAHVRIGEAFVVGRVVAVRPKVENGTVTMDVALEEPSHPSLRHTLRVDVHVVTERRENALVVPRASYVNTDEGRALFVIHGDRAIRRQVELGISSFDAQEIRSGLAEGDRVVLSDMSQFSHVSEVKLR